MLQALRVKNLALVDEADVEFSPGLNVITGETGAGKSILIGALSLLLGERADRSLIRTGETTCSVEAVLQVPDPVEINALLREVGVAECEDGAFVIRRTIRESGTGQNFMNDTSVTLQVLKQVGRLLVDMHGPHDHQSLFDVDFQRELLDAFGGLAKQRLAYQSVYEELIALEKRRSQLEGSDENVSAEIDLLTFRVQEIQDAQLDVDEDASLVEEHQVLANAQHIQHHGAHAVDALTDGEGCAFDALAEVQRSLNDLADYWEEARDWSDEARQAAIQVQELGVTIRGALEGLEANPARLAWLDERMALYDKMKRKYGPEVSDVLERLAESATHLEDLQMRGERLMELEQEIVGQRERVMQAGGVLHQARGKAGQKLAKAIMAHLKDLGLEHAAFDAGVTAGEPGPHGLDDVEYGFAPNPGETMRPLRAIASSGEISRIMLACKVVLAELDRIPVLIFDEVDANVGGEMGHIIGVKLGALSHHRQVLCITHLPQVAVHGERHLAVSKDVRGGRTYTQVLALDAESRVDEVARMLGGTRKTKATLQHAEELLGQVR